MCIFFLTSTSVVIDTVKIHNQRKREYMNITIDETQLEIFENDNNIVDVAKRSGIHIPAPCYYAKRKKGCCYACLVEVNGEKKYACSTKPEEGMKIVFKRPDLDSERTENLLSYKENMNNPNQTDCGCGCDCSSSSGCC